jgi:hypothetical protein
MAGRRGGSIQNRRGNGAAQASEQAFARGGFLRSALATRFADFAKLKEGTQDEIKSPQYSFRYRLCVSAFRLQQW